MDRASLISAFRSALNDEAPPDDYISSEEYAKAVGISRNRARARLKELFLLGKADRLERKLKEGGNYYVYRLKKTS